MSDVSVLCVYGVPPAMPLKNIGGGSTGQTFTLKSTNKTSFERALRTALDAFVGADASIMGDRFVFVRNVGEIAAAIRSGNYTQVVYYGHADQNTNALIPARGVRITPAQLASALQGTTVRHVDILGCKSVSFAAELATAAPALRLGYLTAKRFDNVEINLHTQQVVSVSIDRQPLLHFGPKQMGAIRQFLCLTSVALALVACAHPHGRQRQPSGPDTPDYCQISATALRAAIKPQAREPNALDARCVREYASVGAQIYVDARFTKGGALERVPQNSCTAGEFLIRFDSEHNPQSPAPGVVFLSVDEPTPRGRPFSVTVEESRWAKRPSNVLAMPPCDPAFGMLSGAGDKSGWAAKLVPPPRGPDDL